MTARIRHALLATVCTVIATACSDGGGKGFPDPGDPNAPVTLWPIPHSGVGPGRPSGGAPGSDPWLRPPSSGLDAGANDPGAVDDEDAGPPMDPDPALAQLDPNQVYIFGNVGGSCGGHAIAPVDAPNHALVGFSCYASERWAQIRPTDGRMLYSVTAEDTVYAFHCDGCVYHRPGATYPAMPESNDELVAALPCTLNRFHVAPDGETVFRCSAWVDQNGNPIDDDFGAGNTLLRLGYMNTALLASGVLDRATATVNPFVGLTDVDPIASRARVDGYWIAHQPSVADAPPELWHVAFDGMATLLGVYPAPPPGVRVYVSGGSALDGDGRLVQFAYDDTTTLPVHDMIVRRSIEGDSEVVYDEADNPVIKVSPPITALVTGP